MVRGTTPRSDPVAVTWVRSNRPTRNPKKTQQVPPLSKNKPAPTKSQMRKAPDDMEPIQPVGPYNSKDPNQKPPDKPPEKAPDKGPETGPDNKAPEEGPGGAQPKRPDQSVEPKKTAPKKTEPSKRLEKRKPPKKVKRRKKKPVRRTKRPKKRSAGKKSGAEVIFECNKPMMVRIGGVGSYNGIKQKTVNLAPRAKGYRVVIRPEGEKPSSRFIKPIAGKSITVNCQ